MARRKVDPDRIDLETVVATPMADRGEVDGRRYWRARTTDPSRRTVWTGWATREEARATVQALIVKGLPTSPRSAPGAVRTVADLLNRWKTHQEQRQKAGAIAERSLVNYRQGARYWIDAVGDVLVAQLSRVLVEDQLTTWQADGVSPRTCKLALDILASAVKWGAERGHCTRVDLSRLHALDVRPDEHVNNDYTPTRSEAARVLPHIAAQRERDVVALLALTGARIGEVAALTVGDVDLEGQVLALSGRDDARKRRGKVKVRRWPIAGELTTLLVRLTQGRARDERLVGGLPRDCSDMVRRALDSACAAAGVPPFTAHGLRRMVAMELLEVADPRQVSELTGHSVQVLLTSYVRPRADRLRDLVTRAGVGSLEQRGKVRRLRAHGAQDPGTGGTDAE
jgi:integrase